MPKSLPNGCITSPRISIHSYCTNSLDLGNHGGAEKLHCYAAYSNSYISLTTIQERNSHQFDGFLKTAFNRERGSFVKTNQFKMIAHYDLPSLLMLHL
jgi:hypothetical protein